MVRIVNFVIYLMSRGLAIDATCGVGVGAALRTEMRRKIQRPNTRWVAVISTRWVAATAEQEIHWRSS
jgi:hypothetical protein